MKTYQKEAGIGEISIYQEILNPIAEKYNRAFSILILPNLISADDNLINLPFYEGKTFNEAWNESTGGSLLELDLSSEVPLMLKDLALVDIKFIINNKYLEKIPKLIFNQQDYLNTLPTRLKRFLDFGLLTQEEVNKAIKLLQAPYISSLILNNGDFYPRNFIRIRENKIVLIDWEVFNPHSPFYIIDHIENAAAVCFVHMWNNKPWQEKYVAELQKALPITKNDFQKAVLIKSLEAADFWFKENGNNELCKNQIKLFKNALSEEFMKKFFKHKK